MILALSISIMALAAGIIVLINRLNSVTSSATAAKIQAEGQIKSLFEQLSDALASKAELAATIASLQTLWVVGQYRFGDTGAVVWDLQGVFSARDQAVAACKAPNWFIAPIKLDQSLPEKTEVMPDVEWPLLDKGAA